MTIHGGVNFSTARDYANSFAGELRYRQLGILEELLALIKDNWVHCVPAGSFSPLDMVYMISLVMWKSGVLKEVFSGRFLA